jgi:hypothetical protein
MAAIDDLSINQDFSGGGGFNLFSDTGASAVGAGVGALGSLVGGVTSSIAASDQASGYEQEAALYTQAAGVSAQDIQLAKASGELTGAALTTKIAETEGTGAAIAGAGNTGPGGSNADILRESQRQGTLALGRNALETQIQENSYTQQMNAYQAQAAGATAAASAAKTSAAGGILGGILGAVGSVAKFALPLL